MDPRGTLIVIGAELVAAAMPRPWPGRLGLGHLPGDIGIEGPGVHIYTPIVTCLMISVVLTLLFWVLRK
jgi:hypothetical protein